MSDVEERASGDRGRAADAVGVVRPADTVPTRPVDAGRGTSMQVLVGPEDGAPNFVLRRFRMETGGGIPRHTNEVEHEQFVLTGRARITVGEEPHEVARGDVLYIPAGVPHAYEVLDGPFEFLCVVPRGPDEIRLTEDG